jgi:hypothetical protein
MLNLKQLEYIKSKLPEANNFYKIMGCKSLIYAFNNNKYTFHIGIFIINGKEYYKWIYNDKIILD